MSGERSLSDVRFGGQAAPAVPAEGKLTAGVPLAKLIKRKLVASPELVMLDQHRSVAAEKFRRLKTVLLHDPEGAAQVIVLTSPAPAEGKSLVAINLALSFAADLKGEVLLIDADLRRPTVEQYLSPAPKLGFAELLTGRTELDHVVLTLENSPLKVLPAGSPPRDPVELLSSDYARVVLETLRERYERVIIDTPPIVPFTDADAVGAYADGLLMVARARSTRSGMLVQALQSVTSTRVLGAVLNDVTFSLADRENYYYTKNYYDYYARDTRKK